VQVTGGDGGKVISIRRGRLTIVISSPADDKAVGFEGKTVETACGDGSEVVFSRRGRLTIIIPPQPLIGAAGAYGADIKRDAISTEAIKA